MAVFSAPSFRDHEQVQFCYDRATGLKTIIAVHDTTLGPALGGTRMWAYETDAAALDDALRLSRGMTYKSALAGLALGGGKSVILADPYRDKSPALFEAFGRAVDRLGGRYIAAEDVGTSVADLEHVRRATTHVAGIAEGGVGDPSPATAWGIYHGVRAAVAHKLGRTDLRGLKVAVQGLGHVGWLLCQHLHQAGAQLTVADIRDEMVRQAQAAFGATAVAPDAILRQKVDVVAPCALGGAINDRTLAELKAPIVAGSANNQLAEDRHGRELAERGVLYAPDYVINAGGIIIISHEGPDYDAAAAMAHVAGIGGTLRDIFRRAEAQGIATSEMADHMAEERIARAKGTQALKMAS